MSWKLKLAAGAVIALASRQPALAQHLDGPNNLAIAPNGLLYVVNQYGDNVAIFETSGTFEGSFSTGANSPFRLAVNDNGNLFVGMSNNGNVNVYGPTGTLLRTVKGASGFGLAVDAYGDVISTTGSAAQCFNEAGLAACSYTKDKQGLAFAGGSATIAGQTLYIATGPGGGTSTVATYNPGNFLTGDPLEAKKTFSNGGSPSPTQLALGRNGNIYIAGLGDNMVEYTPTGGTVLTLSGFATATGVAVDGSGNIYVAERDANDIKVFNSAGTLIGTIQ